MPYRYLKRAGNSSYFHIFSRGNNKNTIFLSPADYRRFLEKLRLYSEMESIGVVTYCLMRNHYHFLLREGEQGSIARLMQRLNVSYAMYFNAKYKHTGHLFQGPYGEKEIDSDSYLVEASAYIHNNPCGIGQDPELYEWSSYRDYLGGRSSWLEKDLILGYFPETNKVEAYRQFVTLAQDLSAQDLVLAKHVRPGLEKVML